MTPQGNGRGSLTPADIPAELLYGYLSDGAKAEHYRAILARTGCTQLALAELVGCKQPHIFRLLAKGDNQPKALPARTATTDPRWTGPPTRPHRALELWCAYVAEDLGWTVAHAHPLARPSPEASRLNVDLVLSAPGPWRPQWAVEVKTTILTAYWLARYCAQLDEYASRLECPGLLVAGTLNARLSAPGHVVGAEELAHVIGRAPRQSRRARAG